MFRPSATRGIAFAWTAVGSVIDTIAGWLGFGSPTEEGPGRTSDEWAPNLMKMYTEGLEDGVPDIQDAVGQVTSALANLNMESTTQLISTAVFTTIILSYLL